MVLQGRVARLPRPRCATLQDAVPRAPQRHGRVAAAWGSCLAWGAMHRAACRASLGASAEVLKLSVGCRAETNPTRSRGNVLAALTAPAVENYIRAGRQKATPIDG